MFLYIIKTIFFTFDLFSSLFIKQILCFSTNVDWNSELTVAPLKLNVRLWEFVLKLVKTYLIEIKRLLSNDIKPHNLYENLCKLTK